MRSSRQLLLPPSLLPSGPRRRRGRRSGSPDCPRNHGGHTHGRGQARRASRAILGATTSGGNARNPAARQGSADRRVLTSSTHPVKDRPDQRCRKNRRVRRKLSVPQEDRRIWRNPRNDVLKQAIPMREHKVRIDPYNMLRNILQGPISSGNQPLK